ncbi:uncharacterized protein LOC118183989 isoform X2 [Stegodyphus dumicola]|uniref:uncharacterized protein LOC118183989 isoform X2 n=1 Tax=Stegodyphus dumicola TaxID=202533 RepID=UPI0015B1D1F8|nr:uncharacterized protein LOC118183989 isoform X2 [Stegodyphus dumicola]
MFRIQENQDGTTSILCKSTGSIICTINGQSVGSCRPRPVNVVEPRVHVDASSNESPSFLAEQDEKNSSRESVCCISPIPIFFEKEVTEDYHDDCITQDEFYRCLNIVSKEKLAAEGIEKLHSEFPLRLLSRTKAFEAAVDLQDTKLPDDTPLSSCLGIKILKLNSHKNFIDEQAIMMSIQKYDSFCRFPFNSTKLSCNFPKLRCREKKDYPAFLPQKILKQDSTHVYSYGRRQRKERMITIREGLDKRSRRLRDLCEAKKLFVRIKRLTKEEIKTLTARKPVPIPPISEPDSDEICILSEIKNSNFTERKPSVVGGIKTHSAASEDRTSYHSMLSSNARNSSQSRISSVPLRYQSHFSNSYCKPGSKLSVIQILQKKNNCVDCKVLLRDVNQFMIEYHGDYYVKGTNIHVPFYSDFLHTLKSNKLTLRRYENRKKSVSSTGIKNDHAYHLLPSGVTSSKCEFVRESHSFRLNESTKGGKSNATEYYPINKTLNSASVSHTNLLYSSSPTSPALKERTKNAKAGISLKTDDPASENIPVVKERYIVSRWVFHCFGCGHKCIFYKKCFMDTAVTEHMQIFHSVSDPESFLSSYLDSVNQCCIIEAFPGYKDYGGNYNITQRTDVNDLYMHHGMLLKKPQLATLSSS